MNNQRTSFTLLRFIIDKTLVEGTVLLPSSANANHTTGKMPDLVCINSAKGLEEYHTLCTPLNPIFYPAACIWHKQYIIGYYDSANRRSLFALKLESGEDVRITKYCFPFHLVRDQENILEWKQYQNGDLESERAFPLYKDGTSNNKTYFGRIRLGDSNLIGQVREDGICYVPTHENGVIRVPDFEILVWKEMTSNRF
ncbi:Hypothetical predicted protein [Cloeon dipterum]|uniref:Uncharacterized protein n=1 Tax=Cloeon dipterum TaxID=197152 RepID=A0A8S1E6H5_9INSE|nr:Hypothetical predicted protein [Cloeon dipterum]